MNSEQRQKLCWNCEGNVSFQEENCPFCGVYVGPIGQEIKSSYRNQPAKSKDIPSSTHIKEEAREGDEVGVGTGKSDEEGIIAALIKQDDLLKPLALLLCGSIVFLFSLALFLFSENGIFTLHWNATYWYVYLLCSLPLLSFGWWFLQSVKDVD